MKLFNPSWLRKSWFARVGSIYHSSGVMGSCGWKIRSFSGMACDGTTNRWHAGLAWLSWRGKGCQPVCGETKTEGVALAMLACAHPVGCRATTATGDGGRVCRNTPVYWKLLCCVTMAEGKREIEVIFLVKFFRPNPQQALISS